MLNATEKDGRQFVNIHGKQYETVASRLNRFLVDSPGWSIITDVQAITADAVVMRAAIKDPEGNIRATGHGEERRDSSQINRTSALENAETSAVGRALAFLGYAGSEIASADEVANAIAQQGRQNSKHVHPDVAQNPTERKWCLEQVEKIEVLTTNGETQIALDLFYTSTDDPELRAFIWTTLKADVRKTLAALAKKNEEAAKENKTEASPFERVQKGPGQKTVTVRKDS